MSHWVAPPVTLIASAGVLKQKFFNGLDTFPVVQQQHQSTKGKTTTTTTTTGEVW